MGILPAKYHSLLDISIKITAKDKFHDAVKNALIKEGWIITIDIKDGKIWVQHNGTERGIAQDLLELGVPKQDIVLAFHSPTRRKYTDFAVS